MKRRKLTNDEVVEYALGMDPTPEPTSNLIRGLMERYEVSDKEAGRAYSRVVEQDLVHQVWETRWEKMKDSVNFSTGYLNVPQGYATWKRKENALGSTNLSHTKYLNWKP